jgi:NAD(P)H-hydrate epimerase
MQSVLTRDEMRAADAAALQLVSHDTLVTRAGTAVAKAALQMLGGAYGARVTVIAGKGSNGADALVAAAALKRRGASITVLGATDLPGTLPSCDLVIDGAYGTGFHGTYDAPECTAGTPVLAIDIPSGIDADTGRAQGSAVHATRTVTFAALKPGLLQGDGPGHCGAVEVADIGIDVSGSAAALVDDGDIAAWVPQRARSDHKWSSAVGIAAGSSGMEGSAMLCARGALGAGSGMVRLGSPGNPSAAWPVEVVRMHLPGPQWSEAFLSAVVKCRSVVVGPGLGTDDASRAEIRAVIAGVSVPLVIDADGLTALGYAQSARELLARRAAPTVLTPHDGEYARLMGSAPGEDRLAAARSMATQLGAIVLLKGSLTAVAAPDGTIVPDLLLSASGSPALATAGTGDVLSGIIGGLLARGTPAQAAAALGAHVHGRAASLSAPGLVAGDLPPLVARVMSSTGARD